MKDIVSLDQLDLVNGVYSYADYLTWKFEQAVELIHGKIMKMAAPNTKHQRISWQLALSLGNHFKQHDCQAFAAPFDVRLHDKRKSAKVNKNVLTVVQPDICIICDLKKLDEKGCLGAPDLVIEILSPGNSTKEMKTKKLLYEENEIREYWIFDPERETVHQFHLTESGVYSPASIYVKDETLDCVIFPDLKISLEEIFKFS
ncbi:MAG: Uma2 family endonuclease [Saprospiraceae bacterium]|nr:Uma2 family endonuclease [Saprospiraceae bacterium]